MKINKNLLGLILFFLAFKKFYDITSRPQKQKKLKDQVVVITGASSGIGKAYAFEFAKYGAKLVLAARSTEKLEKLAIELKEKFNTESLVVTTDVSKEESAWNLIESTLDKFNHIDILINNAGIATYEYFYKDSIENMRNVMEVNYWGMVYCTHAALPAMIKRNKGKIINVSSFAGKIAVPSIVNYSATKHAMNGFSDGLRIELSKYNIDLLLVCPTSTKTDIVMNSPNSNSFKLNKNNYMGMSPERVAKETLNALMDNKNELILGAGEKFSWVFYKMAPGLVFQVLKYGHKFVFKE